MPDDRTTDADRATLAALARAAAGELLGPADMQAIWRIGSSQFGRLNKRGAFDQFRVTPAIGLKCFSGVLVHRYLQGERQRTPGVLGKRRQLER